MASSKRKCKTLITLINDAGEVFDEMEGMNKVVLGYFLQLFDKTPDSKSPLLDYIQLHKMNHCWLQYKMMK